MLPLVPFPVCEDESGRQGPPLQIDRASNSVEIESQPKDTASGVPISPHL